MNQHLFKLYNSIKFYLFGGEEIRQATEEDNGKIRHHKSIRDAGALLQDEALPLKQRLEAAHNLGVLGYTGKHPNNNNFILFVMPSSLRRISPRNSQAVYRDQRGHTYGYVHGKDRPFKLLFT